MSRHRRILYVEMNRRLWLYVLPDAATDQERAELWVSDFFQMSIPEPGSVYDVWLVKNMNADDPHWMVVSDYSLDEIGLYSDMTPTQIAERCDLYEQTTQPLGWIDEDDSLHEIDYLLDDDTDQQRSVDNHNDWR